MCVVFNLHYIKIRNFHKKQKKTIMKNTILVQLLWVMIISSCTTSKTTQQTTTQTSPMVNSSSSSLVQPKDPLLGKWRLDYMNPVLGKDINHYKIQKPYLTFVDNQRVAGNNGCNNIRGDYQADNFKIKFNTDKFVSTRMFCEGLDEEVYIRALSQITSYAVMDDGQKLVLSAEDEIMLVYMKWHESSISEQ